MRDRGALGEGLQPSRLPEVQWHPAVLGLEAGCLVRLFLRRLVPREPQGQEEEAPVGRRDC